MRTVKMTLIGYKGELINQWSVPYSRHKVALNHAMERAKREGHAGVIWAEVKNGMITELKFDSYDHDAIARVQAILQPLLRETKITVGK